MADSALEYIAKKHVALKNQYRTSDGRFSESCTRIACEVAQRLLLEGQTPRIVSIRGVVVDSVGNRLKILPKQYHGAEWGTHHVCCVGDIVYDPMIGIPLQMDEYLRQAFIGTVNAEDSIPELKYLTLSKDNSYQKKT